MFIEFSLTIFIQPAWSAYSNKLYTLRNTKNSLVRENDAVNQPIESYCEIQPTYSSYEQLNGYSLSGNTQIESSRKEISYNSYPVSLSERDNALHNFFVLAFFIKIITQSLVIGSIVGIS